MGVGVGVGGGSHVDMFQQAAGLFLFVLLITATFVYLCVYIMFILCTGVVLVRYLTTDNMLRISLLHENNPFTITNKLANRSP